MALYQGTFKDIKNNTITVKILAGGDSTTTVSMGNDGDSIMFNAQEPVNITAEVNDTFDHLLTHSCSISLLCKNWVEDFFVQDHRQGIVNILRGNDMLFCGYIEPRSYSQNYDDVWDEVELSCIDALSATQYGKYKKIGSNGVDYATIKRSATNRTFWDIIKAIIPQDIIIGDEATLPTIIYDGSKSISNATANKYTIFSDLMINELLFLGDEEDKVWDDEEILKQMMQYLNLHIIQIGATFYIFSWETLRAGKSSYWYNLTSNANKLVQSQTITMSGSMMGDGDVSIEIGETYNQIEVDCDVESVEDIITSPLDDNELQSPYTNKQKYMREVVSEGEGNDAWNAYKSYIKNGHDATNYDAFYTFDHYIQVKKPKNWTLRNWQTGNDIYDENCLVENNRYVDQWKLLKALADKPFMPAIFSVGVTDKMTKSDNKVQNNLSMKTYFAISVNGNGTDDEATVNTYATTLQQVQQAGGIAEFNGKVAGGTLSPTDDDTKNYIVFSGKFLLLPYMKSAVCASYGLMKKYVEGETLTTEEALEVATAGTRPGSQNDDGRFYLHQFYNQKKVSDTPQETRLVMMSTPWDDYDATKALEFTYNEQHQGVDNISKVAVIDCVLKIGNKYCVETFSTDGKTSIFGWYTESELPTVTDADGNTYQKYWLSLGFDPAIGDFMIGQEYDMQQTVGDELNIDASGTAIPIKRSDHLSGDVQFKILGPANATFLEVYRRHPTMFRHTSWADNYKSVLSHTSTILIEEFECKIYSDNSLINNLEDKDLKYMSDEDTTYKNVKDGISFKINSALTTKDCQELQVNNSIKMSNPTIASTLDALLTIYDRNKEATAKPEVDYVDSYYIEYHEGHMELTITLQESKVNISHFNLYKHPTLNKTFHVEGISHNITDNTVELKLKEIK